MKSAFAYTEFEQFRQSAPGVLDCLAVGRGNKSISRMCEAPEGHVAVWYVITGNGLIRYADGRRQTLKPGDMAFRQHGSVNWFGPENEGGWDVCWLTCRGAIPAHWLGSLIPPTEDVKHPGMNGELIALYERLGRVMQVKSAAYQIEAGMIIHQLLAASYLRCHRQSERKDPLVESLIDDMRDNALEPSYNIAAFCEQRGVPLSTLRKRFRRRKGQSIHRHFLELKLAEARSLLLGRPDLRIYEIADRVGYHDPYYFIRVFTKKLGVPPAEYRRRHLDA